MSNEFAIVDRFESATLVVHKREYPNITASLAMSLAERWGMVLPMPDGEDSSGRAKFRIATEDEVSDRAVRVAELLMMKIRDKGWIDISPPISELLSKDRER